MGRGSPIPTRSSIPTGTELSGAPRRGSLDRASFGSASPAPKRSLFGWKGICRWSARWRSPNPYVRSANPTAGGGVWQVKPPPEVTHESTQDRHWSARDVAGRGHLDRYSRIGPCWWADQRAHGESERGSRHRLVPHRVWLRGADSGHRRRPALGLTQPTRGVELDQTIEVRLTWLIHD